MSPLSLYFPSIPDDDRSRPILGPVSIGSPCLLRVVHWPNHDAQPNLIARAINDALSRHSGRTRPFRNRQFGAYVAEGYSLVDDNMGVQTIVDFRLIDGMSLVR